MSSKLSQPIFQAQFVTWPCRCLTQPPPSPPPLCLLSSQWYQYDHSCESAHKELGMHRQSPGGFALKGPSTFCRPLDAWDCVLQSCSSLLWWSMLCGRRLQQMHSACSSSCPPKECPRPLPVPPQSLLAARRWLMHWQSPQSGSCKCCERCAW